MMDHDASVAPKSILKNRDEATPAGQSNSEENTLMNANLNGRVGDMDKDDDNSLSPSTRLTWDEANLYLTEQEKNSTMKITEPKTPYAPQYDPSTDADDLDMLDDVGPNAQARTNGSDFRSKVEDIPTLDIGSAEQEMDIDDDAAPKRKVSVGSGAQSEDDEDESRTPEEEAKHKQFEKMRKEHYGGAAAALRQASLVKGTDDEEDETM